MPKITVAEKKQFKFDQLSELNRMSTARQNKLLDSDNTELSTEAKKAFRKKALTKLKRMSAKELKVRVNIDTFSNPLKFSSDNNYTKVEQDILNLAWRPNRGLKAVKEIPAILDQVEKMKLDKVPQGTQDGIIWARSN
jgi:hypothetical protein